MTEYYELIIEYWWIEERKLTEEPELIEVHGVIDEHEHITFDQLYDAIPATSRF